MTPSKLIKKHLLAKVHPRNNQYLRRIYGAFGRCLRLIVGRHNNLLVRNVGGSFAGYLRDVQANHTSKHIHSVQLMTTLSNSGSPRLPSRKKATCIIISFTYEGLLGLVKSLYATATPFYT